MGVDAYQGVGRAEHDWQASGEVARLRPLLAKELPCAGIAE
jgi:hypothetical protein